jgi:uncharacterized protein
MDSSEHQILQRLKQMLQQRTNVHQIILFGSRARGEADAESESDMDVLVIPDQPINRSVRQTVSECTWQAGFDAGIVVTAILFSRDEWEDGPERYSPLAKAVRTEGILV